MSTHEPDVFQLAGTTLEGRFVVERVVAEGGFGVVYLAQQATLQRPVALKVLKTPRQFDEAEKQQFLAGFAAEARTIARIAHPNIVHVYDFGVSDMPSGARAAWMALEWLTGTTFESELLRRRGKGGRSPTECLAIIKPILSALAVVHSGGVAHRDLKPANIMLVQGHGGSTMKLLDFGIAKIMQHEEAPGTGNTQTRSSQIAFSPGYAAPEQISNGRSGPWTDVHAMGLILTEMLADRPALEGEETGLLFQQIVDRVRPTPARFGVGVGAWEAVLCRALAVGTAERHRDAGELLRALEGTVAEATAAYVSIPDEVFALAGSRSSTGSVDTLAIMSTQPALPGSPMAPQLSSATTSAPTSQSDGEPDPRTNRRSRTSVYAIGSVVALALIGGIGWVAAATRPPAPTATIGLVQPVNAVPTAPSAPVVDVSSLPLAPSAPTPAASQSPSATPRAAVPRSAPTSHARAAQSSPAKAAAAAPNCDPNYTLDANGEQHFKPECFAH